MSQARTKISKNLSEKVLNEFNHLCAICGAPRPHLHHIDEDNSNNIASNLIPLCPNHHLSDVHNPTQPFDPLKLSLFRHHKDPQILSPQFEPIFKRLRYLLVPFRTDDFELAGFGVELARFIEGFAMGPYYSTRILELTEWSQPTPYNESEREAALSENSAKYLAKLESNKHLVLELVVEQLRYQMWPIFKGTP